MLGREPTRRHDRDGVDVITLPARGLASSAHARGRSLAEEGRIMLVATDIKRWTLDELHSLPDDGNKYEVVRGVLFVAPRPDGTTRVHPGRAVGAAHAVRRRQQARARLPPSRGVQVRGFRGR